MFFTEDSVNLISSIKKTKKIETMNEEINNEIVEQMNEEINNEIVEQMNKEINEVNTPNETQTEIMEEVLEDSDDLEESQEKVLLEN